MDIMEIITIDIHNYHSYLGAFINYINKVIINNTNFVILINYNFNINLQAFIIIKVIDASHVINNQQSYQLQN